MFAFGKLALCDRPKPSFHFPYSFASGSARLSSSTFSFLSFPRNSFFSWSFYRSSPWFSTHSAASSVSSICASSTALPPFRLSPTCRLFSCAPYSSSPASVALPASSSTYAALHSSRSPPSVPSPSSLLPSYPPSHRSSQQSPGSLCPTFSRGPSLTSQCEQASGPLVDFRPKFTHVPFRRLSSLTDHDSASEKPAQVFDYPPYMSFGSRIETKLRKKTKLFTGESRYSIPEEKDKKNTTFFAREAEHSRFSLRKQAKVQIQPSTYESAIFVGNALTTLTDKNNATLELNGESLHTETASDEKEKLRTPFANQTHLQPASVEAKTTPCSSSFLHGRENRTPLQDSTKPPFVLISAQDLRQAQYEQLEKWFSIAATEIFNEIVWGCPGPPAYVDSITDEGGKTPAAACAMLREAEFCVANYLLLGSLNALRGYKRSNWCRRDGSDAGLEAMLTLCEAEVFDWARHTVANCQRAMKNLELQFPPDQCVQLKNVFASSGSRSFFFLRYTSVFATILFSIGIMLTPR